mgnify:FL=1
MKIDKKRILKHLTQEVFCRLGLSKTHGVGVFALRAIPKGSNPLVSWLDSQEIAFTQKELEAIPKEVKKQIALFCYYDTKKTLVPKIGLNAMTMGIYLNHSKKPNIELKKSGQFKTLRAIKRGEELLLDYDKAFGEKHYF